MSRSDRHGKKNFVFQQCQNIELCIDLEGIDLVVFQFFFRNRLSGPHRLQQRIDPEGPFEPTQAALAAQIELALDLETKARLLTLRALDHGAFEPPFKRAIHRRKRIGQAQQIGYGKLPFD